jgi:hypothetical protein
MPTETKGTVQKPKRQFYWLIYGGALIAGIILIADAVGYAPMERLSAKLGLALVYSALALLIGGSRPSGIIATVLVWIAVVLTFVV